MCRKDDIATGAGKSNGHKDVTEQAKLAPEQILERMRQLARMQQWYDDLGVGDEVDRDATAWSKLYDLMRAAVGDEAESVAGMGKEAGRVDGNHPKVLDGVRMLYQLEEIERAWEAKGLTFPMDQQHSDAYNVIQEAVRKEAAAGRTFADLLAAIRAEGGDCDGRVSL